LKRWLSFILLGVLASVLAVQASAAGGTGVYELRWSKATELLEYRSCGCADACWVAEVRSRKTRALKARLRCDCEKLFASVGTNNSKSARIEKIHAQSCVAFENADKAEAISKALEQLLGR
jgi:hypothetical protein